MTNKYIPADFDPALVPRGTKLSKKDGTVPVRMMLPFTIQCATCSSFLYRGTKFNSKKEAMGGPDGRYLGIQRWRFYIKCTMCSNALSFLTDPKNADYEMESGGSRNYEVYKDKKETEELSAIEKEELEKEDKMKALENRILDSQREMEDLDNLEEIKAMNRRHLQLLSGTGKGEISGADFGAETRAILLARDQALQKRLQQEELNELNEHGMTEDEEALVQSIKFGVKRTVDPKEIRRLGEDDEQRMDEKRKRDLAMLERRQKEMLNRASGKTIQKPPVVKVKRKRQPEGVSQITKKAKEIDGKPISAKPVLESSNALVGLLCDYGSDSDD